MLKSPQSDNFDGGPMMTFGEHLEELRVVVIRALMGLVVAMVIGFVVANYVVEFIKAPLQEALEAFHLKRATNDLVERYRLRGEDVPAEKINRIANQREVPVVQKYDPSGFYKMLAAVFPNLPIAEPEPPGFSVDDVVSTSIVFSDAKSPAFTELAKTLTAKKATEPVATLRDALTSQERETLEDIAGKEEEKVTLEQKQVVVGALNRLRSIPEMSAWQGFTGLEPKYDHGKKTVQDLRKRLARGAPTAGDVPRLNKLLIAAALPGALRPPQSEPIEIETWIPISVRLQALNAQEAFMIWMRTSFYFGLALALPWIMYQLWLFVAAGLYPHEKKYVYIFLPMSTGLFLFGASLAFFFVFKPVLEFLFLFNEWLRIDPDPRMGEWLSFVLLMPIGFGISFQLPLVMLFLNRIGIVETEVYVENWRVAILIIAVVAMVLTPSPDPYSMMLMAVPLVFLYFFGVGLCKWFPRSRNPFPEAYEP